MSKLLKLKKWLTIAEAAERLSDVFQQNVTVVDVVRFAIDGHLKLSTLLITPHGVVRDRRNRVVAFSESDEVIDLYVDRSTRQFLLYMCMLLEEALRRGKPAFVGISEREPTETQPTFAFVVRTEALRDFEQRLADQEEQEEQQPIEDADDELAARFDPVSIERLQAMFPTRDPDQWKKWTERLTRFPTLKRAWVSRGRYNPYYAALFYIEQGHDQPKIMRILAKNLPPRSKDEAFKFRALAGDDALD